MFILFYIFVVVVVVMEGRYLTFFLKKNEIIVVVVVCLVRFASNLLNFFKERQMMFISDEIDNPSYFVGVIGS